MKIVLVRAICPRRSQAVARSPDDRPSERPGITGISHLFEHMMFKGSHVIGTRDYDKDVQLIDEQEAHPGPDARRAVEDARPPSGAARSPT